MGQSDGMAWERISACQAEPDKRSNDNVAGL